MKEMKLWIVCGGRRGVGKTYIARHMCRILPRSVYVKLGHIEPDRAKPGNFFTREKDLDVFLRNCRNYYSHAVIESNALAGKITEATVVFLDAGRKAAGIRLDAGLLKSRADICVSPQNSEKGWKVVLAKVLADRALAARLCELFEKQKQRLEKKTSWSYSDRLSVKSKIWFVRGNEHFFGSGLARLFKQVDRLGSLRQAAEFEGMSYRYAWGLIKAAEKNLGMKFLTRSKGGKHGGGSTLSAEGKKKLKAFYDMEKKVRDYAEKRFAKLQLQGQDDNNKTK